MEIVDRDIPLGQIGRTIGPRPSSGLVRSIRRHGVLVPVLLGEQFCDDGTIEYRVIDGNRRVAAARRARCSGIPARVVTGISVDEAARVTLACNSFRASNYVTEFWAIRQLERSGVSQWVISDDSGMSEAMLATRKLLTSLERRIFMGFAEGRVRPTLALAVARLDRERQRELGDRFEQNGRLLKRDVDGVRYRHHTVAPALEDPSPDTLHREPGIGRVVDFRPRPTADTPRPGTRDSPSTGDRAALATVLAEDARDNLGGSSMPVGPAPALGRDVREYGIPGYIDSGPVQLHSPEPDRSDPPVTAALSSTPANPDTAREQQKPGISHDLRLALRTIAHEAEKQGLDEDAWIEAACEAWRAGPGRQPHL